MREERRVYLYGWEEGWSRDETRQKANNDNDSTELFTFWLIFSGALVHVKSRAKSQYCGFSLKSLSLNESCLLNAVEIELRLMSSNCWLLSKQFRQTMRFVGIVCDFRKSNINVTLLSVLSASVSASDIAMRTKHRSIFNIEMRH